MPFSNTAASVAKLLYSTIRMPEVISFNDCSTEFLDDVCLIDYAGILKLGSCSIRRR